MESFCCCALQLLLLFDLDSSNCDYCYYCGWVLLLGWIGISRGIYGEMTKEKRAVVMVVVLGTCLRGVTRGRTRNSCDQLVV